jgi:DNA invertase Pin-like site-specific DNA recombinase
VSGNGIARLFLTIVSAFAEFERDRIGERIRATKRAQKARGEFSGGVAGFGWHYDEQKQLVAVPEEQKHLRAMRKMRADGLSLRKIADAMKTSGVALSYVGIKRALERAA